MPEATSGVPTGVALGTKSATAIPQQDHNERLGLRMGTENQTDAVSAYYDALVATFQIADYSQRLRGFAAAGPPTPVSATPRKPAGQVALFKIVMDEWGFSEKEAATVLGFENIADIRAVLSGVRPVGHRDANDRLRAVLRIATDLDALYNDAAVIQAWLSQAQDKLGGTSPRELLLEGSMENLLLVKYYAAHLSGRS